MSTIIHKKSKVNENGQAKLPTKEQLVYGELAVNYAKGLETISLKNDNDEIVTFRTNEYYDKIITENEIVTAAALTVINDKLEGLETEVAGKTNNKGTVTSVTVTGKNGLTGSGTVTSAGTITISHATASTATTSSATTLSHNGTFKVPLISRDNYGHITAVTETTYTLPDDSDTHYTSKNIIGASSGATANASATNGNVWLNHIENDSITSKHNIVGSGGTTVKSDANGKVTIDSIAPDHTKTSPTAGTAGTTSDTSGATISIPYVTINDSGHVTTYGTRNHTISASDLGLGQVLKYCGKTTTELTDGSTVKTIIINGASHSATTGCVVFYDDKEFVYNGSTWELLGAESTYKVVQSAVASPNANGDSTAFIDTISQDENGVITVTKKNVKFPAETYTKHEDTSTLSGAYGTSATTTGYAIKQVTVDDKGHVTDIVTGTTPDTKVTSVDNHYTPTSSTTKTASATTATDITNTDGTSVITGIKLDAAGHITDIISAKLKATDTDTIYTHPTSGANTTKGPTANVTGTEGQTIKVPKITVDSFGHVTGLTEYTYTSKDTTYSNATTTASGLMSAADKTKLDGVASGANNYTHPTTSGNKHIPAGGETGQFLGYASDGTAQWVNNPASGKSDSSHNHGTLKLTGDVTGSVTITSGTSEMSLSTTVRTATTGQTGVVKLNNSVTADTTTEAATANAVKTAYDKAVIAYDKAESATTQTGHYSPSITAQTISGGSGQLSHNGTFTVPSLTFDNKGHLVSGGTTTYTLPSDSDTHHTAYLRTASSSTATSNTTDNANGIYFNLVENDTVRSNTILSGTSNVTVTSPTAGTVVITGPSTGTTSTYGLVKISNGDVATIANENGLAAGMDHSHSDYATGINDLGERLDNLVTEIEDNELVTAGALAYLEEKLDDITTEIENNEYVAAQALTDLDTRISNALTGIAGSDGVSVTRDSETGSVDIKLSLNDYETADVATTGRIKPTESDYFYPVQLDKNGTPGVYPVKINEVASYTAATTGQYYLLGHSSIENGAVATTFKSSYVSVSGGTMVLASGGFYQTSDERKKNFIGEIPIDFEKLCSIPKSYFTWKEGDDKTIKIGTSAQAVQKIYPEIVNVDDETGELSLDYALLSVIALKAVDVLYEENQQIKHRLERIEKALGL